jgi:hypothetical protein
VSKRNEIDRRLRDVQANQEIKRLGLFASVELDELRALKRLAHTVFGDTGLLEFDRRKPGNISMGYYVDPPRPGRPNQSRRRILVFHGRSHRELAEQVGVWNANR